jgi:prepilin-type N-terminal cleavage/methylation domain-containing protein
MKNKHASGFSLLELLIVITISGALIVFISQLYRMVGDTANTLFSNNKQWLFERFIRKQLWFLDRRFVQSDLFECRSQEMIFVSQYSAKYALSGPPVLTKYFYDDSLNTLFYTEAIIPPWWNDAAKNFRHSDLFNTLSTQWKTTAITQVKDFKLSYFDGKKWSNTCFPGTLFPVLIKLQFSKTGVAAELIMETRGLSYSMPSGF